MLKLYLRAISIKMYKWLVINNKGSSQKKGFVCVCIRCGRSLGKIKLTRILYNFVLHKYFLFLYIFFITLAIGSCPYIRMDVGVVGKYSYIHVTILVTNCSVYKINPFQLVVRRQVYLIVTVFLLHLEYEIFCSHWQNIMPYLKCSTIICYYF